MWSASSTGTYKHENSPRIRSKCSLFTTFGRTGRSVGMVNDRSRRFLSVPRTQNYINVPQPNPDPLVMVFFLFFFFFKNPRSCKRHACDTCRVRKHGIGGL